MGDVVTRRPGAAFVGREAELARLEELVEVASSGAAAGVLVGGEAGIGKSRLVSELLALAARHGAAATVGRCVDLGAGGLPYLPFAEALAALAGPSGAEPSPAGAAVRAVARERPALLRLTGQEAGVAGIDDALQRMALYEAVALALRSAADAAGALVLVLEDLHWADASTRDLVRFLLARLSDERLLVVGTYRADDLHRRHPLRGLLAELVRLPRLERLDLHPFDAEELRRYLFDLHGGALHERLVRDIATRSEGNAFYAAELLDAVHDCGPGTLPGGLADVLLARVERLPEPVQQVARVAAVAGRRVPDQLLRQALARSGADDDRSGPSGADGDGAGHGGAGVALRDAVAHQVLVPDGAERFAFRHALLQEAIYGDLLPGERIRLHAVYAELLAATPDAATAADLARHSLEAHDEPRALAAWIRAGREAERRLAPVEALTHYEAALQLWPGVPADRRPADVDTVGLALLAAHAASASGEFRRAIALGRSAATAAAEAHDRDAEAQARHCLAAFLFESDQDEQALQEVERVYALLEGAGPNPTRVWATAVEARILAGGGDLWDSRRENLLRAGELVEKSLVEARQLGLRAAEADLLVTLAVRDGVVVGPEAGAERLVEAARVGRDARDPEIELRAVFLLGINRFDVGLLDAARASFLEGLGIAERAGLNSGMFAIESRLLLAQVLVAQGDWDAAVRSITVDPPRLPARESEFLVVPLLPVYAARDPAGVPDRVARLEAIDPDYRTFWSQIYSPLAEAFGWLGRPAEALAAVDQALESLARLGRPLAIGGIQAAAVGLGALADAGSAGAPVDGADELGERLLSHARLVAATGAPRLHELGPEGRGWLLRAEAEATRLAGRSVPAVWRAAYEAFDYGHVLARAHTAWRLAEALLAEGGRESRPEATALLVEARESADRLGARPLRDAVDALAQRYRLDAGAGLMVNRLLTPREEEVIKLVSEGLTNREIGARLFISEKTASVHVSNLLAKLGASGRAEAVAVAHRRGLIGP